MRKLLLVIFTLTLLGAAAGMLCADPVMDGLKGWYKPETLSPDSNSMVAAWMDSSGTGNNLVNYGGGMPTASGLNGLRYIDFANAESYARLKSGTNSAIPDCEAATGMDSTEFQVFFVAADYSSGDLGAVAPSVIGANNEKASFGMTSSNWSGVWGGSVYTGLGAGHQGGNLYTTRATCRPFGTATPASGGFIYEGVFGKDAFDLEVGIDGVLSTQSVLAAPTWANWQAAPFHAVSRGIMIGNNSTVLRAKLYEVLIYNRKLTTAESNQVGEYLSQKYGIAYTPRVDPVPMAGLKGWYKSEALVANPNYTFGPIESWRDSSGTGNDLIYYAGGVSTAVGMNGLRYVDFTTTPNYCRLKTGTDPDWPDADPAIGMDSTEFQAFFVVTDYTGGDLGAVAPSICYGNSEKASFGLRSQNWEAVWGGTPYTGLGAGHQGGETYVTQGTCRPYGTAAPSSFIYEGIYGTEASDLNVGINGALSSLPVLGAPLTIQGDPVPEGAPFGAVTRGIMIGTNYSMLRGHLYEVLIYNRKLTIEESNQVGAYLSGKYGIAYTARQNPPTVGANNKSVLDSIMTSAAGKYIWVLWGKVTAIDADTFSIDDGSGVSIKVVAPGYTVVGGDYVSVKGTLDVGATPPTLTSQEITKHN
ncbi:MAG: hypothetical protein ACYC64_02050 [Armatimonadota bacterium]